MTSVHFKRLREQYIAHGQRVEGACGRVFLDCSCLLPLPTFGNYITRSVWW